MKVKMTEKMIQKCYKVQRLGYGLAEEREGREEAQKCLL